MSDRLRNPASFLPSPSRPSKRASRRRFGLLDLVVGLAVVLAVWSQTPVGALVDHGWAALTGASTEALRPLSAHFDTGTDSEALVALLAEADTPPPVSARPDDGFPEPYRTAAHLVLSRRAPRPAREALRAALAEDPETTWVDLLDQRHRTTPDVEAVLEGLVIEPDQRARAIGRARAAGATHPERWDAHRAYLPLGDRSRGDKVVRGTLALGTALDLTWPVAGPHRITSGWGHRHHPVLKRRKFHNGVDLGVPIGTPILAAHDGVVRTGEDGVSGRYIVLDHGHGVRTSYCHLDGFFAEDGERVDAGQAIARSGNTGRSTGPHLHFVVRVGRKTIDPEPLRHGGDGAGITPGS